MDETTIAPTGCSDYQRGMTRRSFLRRAGAAGLVAGIAHETAFSQLAFAAGPFSGDVLVVLSLRGGFDGLQAIVPASDPDYLTWRPGVGIPTNTLWQLDSTFGMHPAMASLQPFWTDQTFAAVHAVGMSEPNRSHFAAMEEMERAAPGSGLRTGWIDRLLGTRLHESEFQGVQMGSSLAASAFLGQNPELAMWSIDSFGLSAAYDGAELTRWDAALRGLNDGAPDVLSGPALAALGALGVAAQIQDAGAYRPANGALYPDTDLGHALTDVARLIKADVGLQVAAVDYGDWDMHVDMGDVDGGWMVDHLGELSGALSAFATDLGTGMASVTLVSLTEFGRRVQENGSGGTDHGHGQVVLLMGGGVKGGQVHGQWPGLAEEDLVDGDLAATTDYRAILAEVLEKRCGAAAGDVDGIFPGLGSARPDVVHQFLP